MDLLNELRGIQASENPPIYGECIEKLKAYKEKKNATAKGSALPTLEPVDTTRFEAVISQADKIMTNAKDRPIIHVDATAEK